MRIAPKIAMSARYHFFLRIFAPFFANPATSVSHAKSTQTWQMYMKRTPHSPANSRDSSIRFAPMVSHQMIKYGFSPVSASPNRRRCFVVFFVSFASLASCRELRICMEPKTISAMPPAPPTMSLTAGWFATLSSPIASSMTRVNSIRLWAIENSSPLLAPVFVPCVIVTKNSGPGARAPDVLSRMTVAAKLSMSMFCRVLVGVL